MQTSPSWAPPPVALSSPRGRRKHSFLHCESSIRRQQLDTWRRQNFRGRNNRETCGFYWAENELGKKRRDERKDASAEADRSRWRLTLHGAVCFFAAQQQAFAPSVRRLKLSVWVCVRPCNPFSSFFFFLCCFYCRLVRCLQFKWNRLRE